MFDIVFRRIEGVIKSTVSRLSVKLSKLKRLPLVIAKKAKDLLKDIVNFIVKKPTELSDYIKIGDSYVAKRALLAGILLTAAVVLAVIWFVVPFLTKTFFTSRLVVNTPEFHTATGKAEVYTESGALLYSGEMKDGKAAGDGKLYDNGRLVYQGRFADNEYSGSGKLYDEYGVLIYSGEFADSLYNGAGTEYYSSGSKKVSGNYVSGLLEGEAMLYAEDGKLLYSGSFAGGKYNGSGELYQNGDLIYKGGFVNGEMTGEGTLYDHGEKVYSGGFLGGKYSGNGILYRYKTDMRLEGVFEDGLANGSGEVYSADGELLYSGAMSKGEIAYLAYIAADRQQIEQSFTENAVIRELDGKSIVHYQKLGVGFIFGTDGKTDRIVVTGEPELLGAYVGLLKEDFTAPDGAAKYSEFDFVPTEFDRKQLGYCGIKPPELLNAAKYIKDNVFLKLYCSGGRLLYYEVGII
ncbi:MAG: hypothetical protein ACI4J1_02835 [Ruminiclostridium sp.]